MGDVDTTSDGRRAFDDFTEDTVYQTPKLRRFKDCGSTEFCKTHFAAMVVDEHSRCCDDQCDRGCARPPWSYSSPQQVCGWRLPPGFTNLKLQLFPRPLPCIWDATRLKVSLSLFSWSSRRDCSDCTPDLSLHYLQTPDEDLIKYAHPGDVWFHVDKLSSAHVYLRLPEDASITWDAIPEALLTDCAQLVKANSIEGAR
jgi:hypothetical protein